MEVYRGNTCDTWFDVVSNVVASVADSCEGIVLQIYMDGMCLVDKSKNCVLVHEKKHYLLLTVSLVGTVSASVIAEQEVSGSFKFF